MNKMKNHIKQRIVTDSERFRKGRIHNSGIDDFGIVVDYGCEMLYPTAFCLTLELTFLILLWIRFRSYPEIFGEVVPEYGKMVPVFYLKKFFRFCKFLL